MIPHLKKVFILLQVLLYGNLNAQKCTAASAYFKVDSVTKYNVHAGVDGAGSDVTYEVYFKVKRKIQYFDSAWAYLNRSLVILATPKGSDGTLKKNKTYRLVITVHYNSDPRPEFGLPKKILPPINCKEELIVRYKARKKYRYIAFSEFIRLPSINLP